MFGLRPLPRTVEAALRDMEHEKTEVRRSALGDLARHARGASRSRALAALARALLADANAEVRGDAAVALADAEAREARAELLAAIDDAHVRVRQMVIIALGEVAEPGDAEVVAAFGSLLGHAEPAIRFQALIGFERLAGAPAEDALVRAGGDPDEEVRSMAFRLAEHRFEGAEPPRALVEAARRATSEKPTAASVPAALFLASRGERSVVDVLLGALEGRVPVSGIADLQAVIEAAAELEITEARVPLARRAFGMFGLRADPAAFQACIALARLGDARASRTILAGLEAWTRDGRTLAVAAAGRARLAVAREKILRFRGDPSRADPEAVEEALSRLEGVG